LFTVVCLPAGFLFYKHLLRMIGIGSCPVTVDICTSCLVSVWCTTRLHVLYLLCLFIVGVWVWCCTWSHLLTHTTLGRTPLEKGSAPCRDL